MLEQIGTVVAAEGEWLWVETQASSACSACSAHSCGTSALGKFFGVRRNQVRVHNRLQARPGQQVVIGVPDQVLVAASLRAYLLPLLTMLGAGALASALDLGELMQAGMALAGFATGLMLAGRACTGDRAGARYAPRLLRLQEQPPVQIAFTEPMRSRT